MYALQENEAPPKSRGSRAPIPDADPDSLRADLFSSKKSQPATAPPSFTGSAGTSAAGRAPAGGAKPSRGLPPVDEDEDSLRDDLFSSKAKPSAKAGAAAVAATRPGRAPPPPPAEEDEDSLRNDLFAPSKAIGKAAAASSKAPAAAAKPPPPPPAEDEDALRDDLFSAKPKAKPSSAAAVAAAAAGATAAGVSAAAAATKRRGKPVEPEEDDEDAYGDGGFAASTSVPAAKGRDLDAGVGTRVSALVAEEGLCAVHRQTMWHVFMLSSPLLPLAGRKGWWRRRCGRTPPCHCGAGGGLGD
jgi:hypothetical protein